MLRNKDNYGDGDDVATDSNTGAVAKQPKKRGPGRPPGSKNKMSADARALLAKHGLPGVKALCAIAAGRAVYRLGAGSGRERLIPDLDQMLAAQKVVIDRLVPSLKAQEITGADNEPLIPDPPGPVDKRALARSILALLSDAVPRGSVKFDKSDIG